VSRGPDADPDADPNPGADWFGDAGGDRPAGPWGAWVLVVAAAAPLGLWLETARRVLVHGVYNGLQFFLGMPVTTTFTGRFGSLLVTAPPSGPLTCSALGVGALAALAVAGRPAFLVPVALARRAAGALAALTALAAAAVLTATAVYLTDPADPRTDRSVAFAPGTADIPAAAPTTGVVVFVLAAAALAAVVLLRLDGPAPTTAPHPALAPRPAVAPVAVDDVEPVVATPPVGRPEPAAPAPAAPDPGPAVALRADGLPHPGADELARYRRPR